MGLFCLVDRRVTAGALIPGVGGILAPLKGAAPHLRHPDHRPVFWGMLALRAWHYADNHYSGALWLLYVMIWCGARTLAPICLVKCLASTSWRRRSHRVKHGRAFWRFADRGSDFTGPTACGPILTSRRRCCWFVRWWRPWLRCWAT